MLPETWIERIFSEMSVLYGSKFADLWAGADPKEIRAGWAKRLAGFEDHPKAIRAALDSLDERPFPPTLPEFIALCRNEARRLGSEVPQLAHKPTEEERERAEAAAKKAAAAARPTKDRDFLDWARKPRSRLAFAELLKLANPSGPEESCDMRFRKILAELTAAGVSDGQSLLKVWTGNEWAAA